MDPARSQKIIADKGFRGHGQLAVNMEIALDLDINRQPLKVEGSKDFLPLIAQTLAGWSKKDPKISKMPVEIDVPEFLITAGLQDDATELKVVGDSAFTTCR